MNSRRAIILIAVLALMLAPVSCVRPGSVEKFIPASKAVDGVYVFDFEMNDTLSTYDFSFFTRVDGPQLDSLPLRVMWLAPSGESFSETVYMDPEATAQNYRTGVQPMQAGQWRICVRPVVESSGFRGLGLICRENGTR